MKIILSIRSRAACGCQKRHVGRPFVELSAESRGICGDSWWNHRATCQYGDRGESYTYVPPGSETSESQAYFWHREPPEYVGRIAVLSLSNQAELAARLQRRPSDEIECRLVCVAGLQNYFPVDLEHVITPPLIDGEKRFVAAFGTRRGYDVARQLR